MERALRALDDTPLQLNGRALGSGRGDDVRMERAMRPRRRLRWIRWLPWAMPAMLGAQDAVPPQVRCRLVQHYACGLNGCNAVTPDTSQVELVMPALSWLRERVAQGPTVVTIRRCVGTQCQEVAVRAEATPHMVALVSGPAAYLVKIYDGPGTPLLAAGSMVEVETVLLGTHTRYGRCPRT